jgi:hypothetical protein
VLRTYKKVPYYSIPSPPLHVKKMLRLVARSLDVVYNILQLHCLWESLCYRYFSSTYCSPYYAHLPPPPPHTRRPLANIKQQSCTTTYDTKSWRQLPTELCSVTYQKNRGALMRGWLDAGMQPPTPSQIKTKKNRYIDTMILNILCLLPFSRNQPLKWAAE